MSIGPLANALRAAVLGANDGLASNLSLVMGVAGAHMTSKAILVTGLSGLVAGACAMAMGEWLSVSTSRESDETHVDVDAQEPADISEEEKEQLASIYLVQGISAAEARSLADRLATTRKEDFGGYAWNAAMWSFLLFASGALFPVVPYFFLSGSTAVLASIAMSSAVLFLIGGRDLYGGPLHRCDTIRLAFPGRRAAHGQSCRFNRACRCSRVGRQTSNRRNC
jgi:VIT1/CCC1 family predicted Fe2+/Mn2+ transporter